MKTVIIFLCLCLNLHAAMPRSRIIKADPVQSSIQLTFYFYGSWHFFYIPIVQLRNPIP